MGSHKNTLFLFKVQNWPFLEIIKLERELDGKFLLRQLVIEMSQVTLVFLSKLVFHVFQLDLTIWYLDHFTVVHCRQLLHFLNWLLSFYFFRSILQLFQWLLLGLFYHFLHIFGEVVMEFLLLWLSTVYVDVSQDLLPQVIVVWWLLQR